ncbi:hypothetical protein [Rhizobium sp. 768_B6_N1_8]|uniref:hypothetical protein n=1 Tax=unclassified Rhizobium TaxID=2613769 RepID=UPI003F239F50
MSKPRITAAAVVAAHEVFERYSPPENYFKVSSDEQRRIRMSIVRVALIAACTADQMPSAAENPIVFGMVDECTWIHLRMEQIIEVLNEMRDEGYCSDHMRPLEDEFTFLRGRLSMLDSISSVQGAEAGSDG